ncbi:MAG: HD domain-containing protein [Planctomycetota bacterium]|jgi:predicted hydrolase (HD superfamily)
MSPDEARALMHEWTESEALRGHMEAVAACCRSYAELLDAQSVDRWEVCGILHDFDYQKHPTEEEHPFVGVRHLESIGVDEEIREAILGHAEYSGVARESAMAKALFGVDELAGFIVACAKVRPNGISDLAPKSVKKKLKDRAFAAAVSRDDIANGHADLEPLAGLDMTAHIQRCIDAIRDAGDRVPI